MTDYKRDTLDAYKTTERAAEYKRFHTSDWSWGRIVTWLEQRALVKEMKRYESILRALDADELNIGDHKSVVLSKYGESVVVRIIKNKNQESHLYSDNLKC